MTTMTIPADTTPAPEQPTAKKTSKDEPRPLSLREWVGSWDLDHRYLHPYVGAAWVYSASYAPELAGVSPWWMLPAGLSVTALSRWAARRKVDVDTYGAKHQQQAGRLAVLAGSAATVWATWASLTSPMDGEVMGALGLTTLLIGGTYAAWRTRSKRKAEIVYRAKVAAAEQALFTTWNRILARAGLKGVAVAAKHDNRAGYTLVVQTVPGSTAGGRIDFAQVKGSVSNIAAVASQILADTGAVIGPRGVRAEETPAAHRWLLHVTTQDVLAQVSKYTPRYDIASIADPIDLGQYETGEALELLLHGVHGKFVGATRSGKSVLLNNVIARLLECDDAVVWVGGTVKLMPLVYPWLEPWITRQTTRPAIDWVAGERQQEVLEMLADALRVISDRCQLLGSESKLNPSHRLPALVIILDEASEALKSPDRIKCHDGVMRCASEIANLIGQTGAAVNVTELLASQYGIFQAFGTEGNEMHRHLTLRVALKTLSSYDGRDTLVGMDFVDTTKLTNKTMIVQPSIEEPRAVPAKAAYLEGSKAITPLVRRCTGHIAYLDPFSTRNLRFYPSRWTPQRQEALVNTARNNGHTPPLDGAAMACMRPDDRVHTLKHDDNAVNAIFNDIAAAETRPTAPPAQQQEKPMFDSGPADPASLSSGLANLADVFARGNAEREALAELADPLGAIARWLGGPDGPKPDAFVPTASIAVALGRVAADAAAEDVTKATVALGRDIKEQCPAAQTIQESVGGKQVRGFWCRYLWAVIHHAASGGTRELPDDPRSMRPKD